MSDNRLLPIPANAVQSIRKSYNLYEPGRMEEAINLLMKWIEQENHILKKDFEKSYLERVLINNKGSLEKSKKRIDTLCTVKTLSPRFFTINGAKAEFEEILEVVNMVPLSWVTEDLYRVFILMTDAKYTTHHLFLFLQYCILVVEYLCQHDYVNGYIFVDDIRELNIFEFVTQLNTMELQQCMSILLKGYGIRIKGIHVVSQSKVIDLFTTILCKFVSPKLTNRIHVYKNLEEVFNTGLAKDNFPEEYGGNGKSLKSVQRDWLELVWSEENMKKFKNMSAARTDEKLRTSRNFNEEYLGIPGSFRHLSVD